MSFWCVMRKPAALLGGKAAFPMTHQETLIFGAFIRRKAGFLMTGP